MHILRKLKMYFLIEGNEIVKSLQIMAHKL